MTAGRPPKPIEQKRKLGNPGKRALPDPVAVQTLPAMLEVPEPPRPLGKPGMELWERVWGAGAAWISPQTDLELLLMTCEMIDERWNLRIKSMQSDNMQMARRVDNLSRLIVSNLSLLGFTPTDRARLGVAEVKRMTKVEELRAKRENL